MRALRLLILLLLAAAVLAAGCSRKRTVVVPGGHATVTENGGGEGKVEVKTDDGKATVEVEKKVVTEAELGVPVYPGSVADVSGSYEGSAGQSETMKHHMLSTPDDFDKVFAFYKSKLKNVENTMNQTAGSEKVAVFALKPEGGLTTSVSITSDKENKVTRIQVIRVQKPGN